MNYHIVFIPLNPDHLDWTQDVMQQIQSLSPQLKLFLDSNFDAKIAEKIRHYSGVKLVIIGQKEIEHNCVSLRNFNLNDLINVDHGDRFPWPCSVNDFIKIVSNQFRHLIREDRINSILN